MYCICCKEDKVKPVDPVEVSKQSEEDLLCKKEVINNQIYNVNSAMISNGIIQIIEAGYGSKHDGDQLIIAICDDCIMKNLEDATLLYYEHVGVYYPDMIKEDIEKSKKAYRRRKNLDNLT